MGLWSRIRSFLLVIGILACTTLSIAGTPATQPALNTDSDKFELLMKIKEHIPGLFSEAAKYDISLLGMLDEQKRLYETLQKDVADYNRAMAARSNYLTIEIGAKNSDATPTVDRKAFENWRAQLLDTIRTLPAEQPPGEALLKRARELFQKVNVKSSSGLMTGLIQSLPSTAKAQAFKAGTVQEKLAILARELPAQIPNTFKAMRYGLPETPTKEVALAELTKIIQTEQAASVHEAELQKTLQALTIAKSSPTASLTAPALQKQVETLTAEEAQKEFGRENLKRALDKDLLAKVGTPQKAFIITGNPPTTNEKPKLILKEEPPWIGIFRGCAGGDCSSQYSFPYPNSPNERVFFVYDEAEKLKGYATGSIVEQNGKKAFYLVTIAGPTLSADDAKKIMSGLHAARTELAVERIVLPENEQTKALINYSEIRKAYNEAVLSKQPGRIQYTDVNARTAIQNFQSDFNQGSYDHMERNVRAVPYDPDEASKSLTVQIQERPLANPMGQSKKNYTQQELIEFALDLSHANRISDLDRVYKLDPTIKPVIGELILAQSNPEKLPIAEFENRWITSLKKHDIDPTIFEHKDYLLRRGLIKASDAANITHREKVISALIDEMTSRDYVSLYVSEFISAHHEEVLEKDKKFAKFLAKLVNGAPEDNVLWSEIIHAGVNPPTEHWSLLRSKLDASDSDVRRIAMLSIAKSGKADDQLAALVINKASHDPNEKIRHALADLITGLPLKGEQTQLALVETLNSPTNDVYGSLKQAGPLSERAKKRLLEIYETTSNNQIKFQAFDCITQTMTDDPRGLEILFSALEADDQQFHVLAQSRMAAQKKFSNTFISELNKRYIQLIQSKNYKQARSWLKLMTSVARSNQQVDRRIFSAMLYGFQKGDEELRKASFTTLLEFADRDVRITHLILNSLTDLNVREQTAAIVSLRKVQNPPPPAYKRS